MKIQVNEFGGPEKLVLQDGPMPSALMREAYPYLFKQAATGKLKVHIGQTFSLKDAAEAHGQMENRKTTGKTLLFLNNNKKK